MAKTKSKPKSEIDSHIEMLEAEIKRFKKDVDSDRKVAPVSVVSASKVAKIEKEVEHEVKDEVKFFEESFGSAKDTYSLSFYFAVSLVCVAWLSYLFGSIASMVFYIFFSLFIWHVAERHHRSGSGAFHQFMAFGFIVPFLYLFHYIFNDALSLIMCITYSLSFVVSGLLYFYHTRRELSEEIHKSFPRTFLVTLYAHMIAGAFAYGLLYFIPEFIFQDNFVSVIFLILAWIFPAIFVYFFMTRFLYLRFFDRKHVVKDMVKGLAHGAIYSVVLIVLIVLAYILTAMQLVMMERQVTEEGFISLYKTLSNVEPEISAAMGDNLAVYRVAQEAIELSNRELLNATEQKTNIILSLSMSDYIDDNYFTVLVKNRLLLHSLSSSASGVDELKSDILREYGRLMKSIESGVFDDGSTNIDEYNMNLKYAVEGISLPPLPPHVLQLQSRFSASFNSYSGLLGDDQLLEFNIAYYPEFSVFRKGTSRFMTNFARTLEHTVLFRDFMSISFSGVVDAMSGVLHPYPVSAVSGSAEEVALGSVLRYRVLKSNYDALSSVGS